jgi:hypothetical protein
VARRDWPPEEGFRQSPPSSSAATGAIGRIGEWEFRKKRMTRWRSSFLFYLEFLSFFLFSSSVTRPHSFPLPCLLGFCTSFGDELSVTWL